MSVIWGIPYLLIKIAVEGLSAPVPIRVTRSLPYIGDGVTEEMRRDRVDAMLAFSMSRARWETVHRNDIEISGLEPPREFLGL